MRHLAKRFISCALIVGLLLSMMSVPAFATETCNDGCFTENGITYLPISGKTDEVEVVNPSLHPLSNNGNPGVSTYTGEITIPAEVTHDSTTYKVTAIGRHAFYGYDNVGEYSCSVTKVALPEGITEIGEGAFSYCTSLSSLNIPSTVTTIGASAFANCTALTALEIPSGVTSGLAGRFAWI